MGAADIVPGVSGGTVALITGIYDELIKTISSFDHKILKLLFSGDFKSFMDKGNFKFLVPLLSGILIAIIGLSHLMHFLMGTYPVQTWSLFFGLIVASIIFLGKGLNDWKKPKMLSSFIIGTVLGYLVTTMIPVETSNNLINIFIAGSIAICAMILPGISGSFILLILGKYFFVTSALKSPFAEGSLLVILTFAFGCFVGLLSFSKILNFLLIKYHSLMMYLLVGFMLGSLNKIWPWREVLSSKIIRGKTHVLSDKIVFPSEINSQVITAFLIMIFGIVLVFAIEKYAKNKSRGVSSAG